MVDGVRRSQPIMLKSPEFSAPRLRDNGQAFLVCQREFGLARAPQMVRTPGFNSCVNVAFHSVRYQIGGLAHFDIGTSVRRSFDEVILPTFERLGIAPGRTQARIISGQFESSRSLCQELRDVLQRPGRRFDLKGITFIPALGSDGLILDIASGVLYERIKPEVPDQDYTSRNAAMLEYLLTGNPVLRDVTAILARG